MIGSNPEAIESICVVCNKKFKKYAKPYTGRRMNSLRRTNSICCSKECSKIYAREKWRHKK